MKKYSHLYAGIAAGIAFLILFNISSFAHQCKEIRSNVIRLHVIANSDSDADQDVKLKVRDAILEAGSKIFDGTVTTENAIALITPELTELKNTADKILKINGMDYTARAELVTEYFDTRTYGEDVTLPAGKYLALKIVLGEGNGKNWWCVMFPSLCLPAAEKTDSQAIQSVFNDTQETIVKNKSRYEIRFKLIEYIEIIKSKVDI